MTNAEYLRTRRAAKSALGKCNECSLRDAEPDLRTCRVCLDSHRDRHIRQRSRRSA